MIGSRQSCGEVDGAKPGQDEVRTTRWAGVAAQSGPKPKILLFDFPLERFNALYFAVDYAARSTAPELTARSWVAS